MEENAKFIKDFRAHLVLHSDSGSEGSSTISKATGNLFHYERSYLNFSMKKIEGFNLSRLLDPFDDKFLEIEDPTIADGWFQSVGGHDGKNAPGIQLQMLKDHKHLREYVLDKIRKKECGNSSEAYLVKDKVLNHIKDIEETIKKKKLVKKLKRLDDQCRLEKLKAKSLLNPQEDYNAQVAVDAWFKSEESKKLEAECDQIYRNVMEGAKIGPRSFTKHTNFTRFYLVLHSRNRIGTLNFTNKDFAERKPKYLPNDTFYPEDDFKSLPDDWNPDVAPYEGAEPSCWVIELTGDGRGLKGGRATWLVISRPAMELCLRYREMKLVYLGERPSDVPFFENADKQGLSALRLYKGSMLDRFAKACNLTDATINTFRKCSENLVQSSPAMKKDVEAIQSHTKEVALAHYYQKSANVKSNYIVQLNQKEGAKISKETSQGVLLKRKVMDDSERSAAIDRAKKFLFDDKAKKSLGKGKVDPGERKLIQDVFRHIIDSRAKFPGEIFFIFGILNCFAIL